MALLSLSLAAGSVAYYRQEVRARASSERFARRFTLDLRRPLDVETTWLEPAGDLASAAVVDAALRESPDGVRWKDLTPRLRGAWLEWIARRDEELREAGSLMLEAVALRPGWAYHRFLLGHVMYAIARRSPSAGPARRPELWAKPLRLASAAAPGIDAIWEALGEAYLETWPALSSAMRSQALPVWKRAFLDPGFVSRAFPRAAVAVGRDSAAGLLPEIAKPLRAAFDALAREGDLSGAASLLPRVESTESRERGADLRKIEKRQRFGDVEGQRAACIAWVSDHPIGDFDDREGRTQVARLLELWPNDRIGDWGADPRGDLVRFFLNGRERHVKGEVMARALEALSDVPLPVKGRVDLLAGDRGGAEALARQSETEGSLEWTGFLIELARFEAKRGRARQARIALERLQPEDYGECDSLLARRDVARALGDSVELEAVNRRLRWPTASFRPEGGWSAGGTLALCVDPEQSAERLLTVEVAAEGPALVAYGWDGGRLGIVLVQRNLLLRLPLRGLSGRRNFSVRSLFGGPAHPAGAFITGVS